MKHGVLFQIHSETNILFPRGHILTLNTGIDPISSSFHLIPIGHILTLSVGFNLNSSSFYSNRSYPYTECRV